MSTRSSYWYVKWSEIHPIHFILRKKEFGIKMRLQNIDNKLVINHQKNNQCSCQKMSLKDFRMS